MAILYGLTNTSQVARISEALTKTWCPIGAVSPEGYADNIVPFTEGLEVKAHFAAQQAQRAQSLIRLSWGWYLANPNGTGSTAIEGYKSDGSFNYHNDGYDNAGSYPSHAHGWSAGPADALTNYVVGLQVASPGGKTWVLQPQMGDLQHAQGGFTTPLGKFSSGWERAGKGISLWVDVPRGTNGEVYLDGTVVVDGRKQSKNKSGGISLSGGYHRIAVM